MIIEIQGYEGDFILWGQADSLAEVKHQFRQALKAGGEGSVQVRKYFIDIYQYEKIEDATEIEIDILIDTDTHHIYRVISKEDKEWE